ALGDLPEHLAVGQLLLQLAVGEVLGVGGPGLGVRPVALSLVAVAALAVLLVEELPAAEGLRARSHRVRARLLGGRRLPVALGGDGGRREQQDRGGPRRRRHQGCGEALGRGFGRGRAAAAPTGRAAGLAAGIAVNNRADLMTTGVCGRFSCAPLGAVGVVTILSTTSMPSTSPNTA